MRMEQFMIDRDITFINVIYKCNISVNHKLLHPHRKWLKRLNPLFYIINIYAKAFPDGGSRKSSINIVITKAGEINHSIFSIHFEDKLISYILILLYIYSSNIRRRIYTKCNHFSLKPLF